MGLHVSRALGTTPAPAHLGIDLEFWTLMAGHGATATTAIKGEEQTHGETQTKNQHIASNNHSLQR